MAGIFISYRRDDSAGWAGRISDRLKQKLQSHEVFFDVSSIGLGDDYTVAIDHKLSACRVVLVLMGDEWTTIQDGQGGRRIDDPQDVVRLEVGRALSSEAKVIPLLVDGAPMPSRAELPEDLALLANYQALEVRTTSFERDVDHLAGELAVLLGGPAVAAAAPTPIPAAESRPARTGGGTRNLVIGAVMGAIALALLI